VKARSDEEEPDWDKEMSIFKQRTMAPNQLATLRELESKVSLGRVRSTGRQTIFEKMPAIANKLLCRLQPDLAQVTAAVAALQHGQAVEPAEQGQPQQHTHLPPFIHTNTNAVQNACRKLLVVAFQATGSISAHLCLPMHPTTDAYVSSGVGSCCMQVLWCKDSLVIMTGINPDAPLGTKLAFVSGGSG
jgi:hypothetical protein